MVDEFIANGTVRGVDGRSHDTRVGARADSCGAVPCTGHGGPFIAPIFAWTGNDASFACI